MLCPWLPNVSIPTERLLHFLVLSSTMFTILILTSSWPSGYTNFAPCEVCWWASRSGNEMNSQILGSRHFPVHYHKPGVLCCGNRMEKRCERDDYSVVQFIASWRCHNLVLPEMYVNSLRSLIFHHINPSIIVGAIWWLTVNWSPPHIYESLGVCGFWSFPYP